MLAYTDYADCSLVCSGSYGCPFCCPWCTNGIHGTCPTASWSSPSCLLLWLPAALRPLLKLQCKARELAVLGRLGLTCQRKSCGNCLVLTVIPPKENPVVSVEFFLLTAAGGSGQGGHECCAGAPGQPQEPLIECHEGQSWYPAGSGPKQGYIFPQLVFLSHCCHCSCLSFFRMSLLVARCLSAATETLLYPAFLPLSHPCSLPAPTATVASAVSCSPDEGITSPSPAADWWDKHACQTALLLVKDADSGSSMPIRQSREST